MGPTRCNFSYPSSDNTAPRSEDDEVQGERGEDGMVALEDEIVNLDVACAKLRTWIFKL